jgi:RNA polymerase sigma factor (TIGR02999 family)
MADSPTSSKGDPETQDPEALLERVYEDLRKKAAAYLRRESPGHTLQPTALANEAWSRLVQQTRVHWKNEGHVMAVAAQAMRRILVDHARKKRSHKRGEGWQRVDLDSKIIAPEEEAEDLLLVDRGIDELREQDSRLAETVELKIFTGLSSAEIAEVRDVSKRTVERDWRVAQAWLRSWLIAHRNTG